jgi:bifunctional aspartokinase / homoserine dehydrogenase 1
MKDLSRIRPTVPEIESRNKSNPARILSSAASRRAAFVEPVLDLHSDGRNASSRSHAARILQPHHLHAQPHSDPDKRLLVMKFGGTSVRDESCIRKVVGIVQDAARENRVAVVVSAMSGVTSKLLEVAGRAEAGDRRSVAQMLDELLLRHESVADRLLQLTKNRHLALQRIRDIFQECRSLCEGVLFRRELTARTRDAISGMGERLSAPLVTLAFCERGVASSCVEATELVVTNDCYGAAEPFMDLTTARCQARLYPLLRREIVPVVTGFIGATLDHVPTTLGRNSSDFSGTILGAALLADEVTLWTDVDGILTADPKLVPGARTIAEMSYSEATDLADLGAKVLHPKTLKPVMDHEIPLVIRNTFAPEHSGTKITATSTVGQAGASALIAANDLVMISLCGIGEAGIQNFWGRVESIVNAAHSKLRLVCQLESRSDISFVVQSTSSSALLEALRSEFAEDLSHAAVTSIALESDVAIITVVTQRVCGNPGLLSRAFDKLAQMDISVIGVGRDYSEARFSVVVGSRHLQYAMVAIHDEFHRDVKLNSPQS